MFEIIVISIILIIMLSYYMRCNSFIKSAFLGTSSGLISLGILGIFSPNLINLNVFIACISATAGIPGVLTLVLLNKFLMV